MSYGCDWLFPKQYYKMVMIYCKNLHGVTCEQKSLKYYLISKIECK